MAAVQSCRWCSDGSLLLLVVVIDGDLASPVNLSMRLRVLKGFSSIFMIKQTEILTTGRREISMDGFCD